MTKARWASIHILLLLSFLAGSAIAQDAETAPATTGDTAVAATVTNNQDGESAKTTDPIEEATRIQALGRAAWLQIRPGMFHVGPVYMNDLSYSQVFDRFGQGANTQSRTTSALTANMFYTRRILKHSQIAFQYSPNLYIIDGTVKPDFVHQNFSVTSAIPLSRRLTLSLSDQFTYMGRMGLLENTPAVDFDPISGNYLLSNYLQTAQNSLSNAFDVSMSYTLNQRWNLTLSPNFRRLYNDDVTSQSYGARIGAAYQMSARRTVGFGYSYLTNRYNSRFSNAQYHSVEVSVNQMLGRGFTAYVALSGTTQPLGDSAKLAFTPTVRVSKQFRSSSLFGTYTRTPALTMIVRDGFSDQIAVGYSTAITRKLSGSLSLARYSETGSTTDNQGKYGTAQVSYALHPQFSVFTSFTKRVQEGDPSSVFIGNRNSVMFGITWAPTPRNVPQE
ncbi:MAG TPA: hypothetical protein VN577_20950 [Terriglobales bacterium]|nr:hypothetical protein [Terriglobales bacterium]